MNVDLKHSTSTFPTETLEIRCPKGKKFTDMQITTVIYLCSKHNEIQQLFVNKNALTKEQIQKLEVAANNECKGLAIKDPNRPSERFGNFVTDLNFYYQDKGDSYKEGIRETLAKARELYYEHFKQYPETIMDFGCGEGHDILAYLLEYPDHSPTFLAVDSWKPGLEQIKTKLKQLNLESASVEYISKAYMKTSIAPVDLISGSYAFPYRSPEVFDAFWNKITANTNKMICGHHFGYPDEVLEYLLAPLNLEISMSKKRHKSDPLDLAKPINVKSLLNKGPKPGMTYHNSEIELKKLYESRGFKIIWSKEEHDVKTHGDNDDGREFGKLFHVVAIKS